jgi:hypothetical protein
MYEFEPKIAGAEMEAVEHRWVPENDSGQGFEIVDSLRGMFSTFYRFATEDEGKIGKLRLDPGSWGVSFREIIKPKCFLSGDSNCSESSILIRPSCRLRHPFRRVADPLAGYAGFRTILNFGGWVCHPKNQNFAQGVSPGRGTLTRPVCVGKTAISCPSDKYLAHLGREVAQSLRLFRPTRHHGPSSVLGTPKIEP